MRNVRQMEKYFGTSVVGGTRFPIETEEEYRPPVRRLQIANVLITDRSWEPSEVHNVST